jgi:uncharacterized protein with von Willebrand factor type A (vWA) domain
MSHQEDLGGIIHTYLGYDPVKFPSPTAPPPDMASAAMEHLLYYGNTRQLTEEELANAVRIDPSQIRGLGPSLDAMAESLRERKRKILERYETSAAQKEATKRFHDAAEKMLPPGKVKDRFREAVKQEQLLDLEDLYYSGRNDPFSRSLVPLIEKLGEKYQVDELASKYAFTGRETMDVSKALEIKEELETIDKLLEQIAEAMKTAQIGLIDMDQLSEYIGEAGLEELRGLQQQINEYLRDQAERQGLERSRTGFNLTPQAYRLFQSKILSAIFDDLHASKSGRHANAVIGEGAVESQRTKDYEFGDSIAQMDIPGSMVNTMLRSGAQLPVRMRPDDIIVHRTQVTPKAATTVLLDMSGSMRYDELYVNVKKMGLALDGLIRKEFPGDFLQFVEMFTFAKPRSIAEIPELMPKPVTIFNPVVRLKADMSDPDISEMQIPPHFTNIQHAMQVGRRFLTNQDTPNRQMVIITDGLPTAHFEGSNLFLLYPPDRRTEEATLREAKLCAREGIVINIFLLQSWNQTEEDVRFAYRLAESTQGRVIFTAGKDLDRFVIWDYLKRKKAIVG